MFIEAGHLVESFRCECLHDGSGFEVDGCTLYGSV